MIVVTDCSAIGTMSRTPVKVTVLHADSKDMNSSKSSTSSLNRQTKA